MRANGRSSEGGFTIVELLVVLIICAILFAIVLPQVNKTRQKTGGPTVNVAAAGVWRGIQHYRMDTGGAFRPIGQLQSPSTFADPGGVRYVKRWPENARGGPIQVSQGPATPTSATPAPGALVYYASGVTGYLIGYSDTGSIVFRREAGNWNTRPEG
jgi:prepilin-type N-terminal cleavage/methylation domain-containing protein